MKFRNKKFRKWLKKEENWRLLDFWFKVMTMAVLILGIIWGTNKVITNFKEIKAEIGKFEKIEVCDDEGHCINMTPGATSTIGF